MAQDSGQHNATAIGTACGVGAGALWGLVFLAPELLSAFNPVEMTVGRYVAYGLISAVLIAPRWRMVRSHLTRADWMTLAWLSLAGNTLYYILLSGAVQLGGIAMTSLVIGFLPVAVTIIGSRDHGAVPLARLAPSLVLCTGAALCIGWQAVVAPYEGSAAGLLLAVGALASWTAFGVGNARWLPRVNAISSHDWILLIGLMTGAQSLLLVPVALALGVGSHTATAWSLFAGVSVAIALFASIGGGALWNRMSRLLPLTLAGQMILFETLFAMLYAYLWEHRWPTMLEAAAFALIVVSVVSCLSAHRQHGMGAKPGEVGPVAA
jgi:drug/metabolite transporter (DMT)-like permease